MNEDSTKKHWQEKYDAILERQIEGRLERDPKNIQVIVFGGIEGGKTAALELLRLKHPDMTIISAEELNDLKPDSTEEKERGIILMGAARPMPPELKEMIIEERFRKSPTNSRRERREQNRKNKKK